MTMIDPAQEQPRGRLRITKHLPATCAQVFAAWTDAESMKRWMRPENAIVPLVELDVRVGGHFRIDMSDTDGTMLLVHTGEYIELKPPHRLVFTWISDGTRQQRTLVTIELREQTTGCELTLTHEQLPDAALAERHESGWGQMLVMLAHELHQR